MAENLRSHLYFRTPLLESIPISKRAGYPVFLKCENVQPSGSFKMRGISNRCRKGVLAGYKRIVSSSGGNAGYAAACSARMLGIPAVIVVPETTSKAMGDRLRDAGAEVIVHGKVWDEANDYAMKILDEDKTALSVHPFDHPDVWEGHSSMIEEIKEQLPCKPDVVVTCVGGGGLLCGVIKGLQMVGWNDVPVVAMETVGADCFNKSLKAGELVTLPGITSIAKSLGALKPAEECFALNKTHTILSEVVDDQAAVKACANLLDDHCILVEPACGASLAAVYSNVIPKLQDEGKLKSDLSCVVVIVCGGAGISLQDLLKFKEKFGL